MCHLLNLTIAFRCESQTDKWKSNLFVSTCTFRLICQNTFPKDSFYFPTLWMGLWMYVQVRDFLWWTQEVNVHKIWILNGKKRICSLKSGVLDESDVAHFRTRTLQVNATSSLKNWVLPVPGKQNQEGQCNFNNELWCVH